MSADLRKRVFIILAVIIGALVSLFPLEKRINLGLDLKGGMHLILKVENEQLATPELKNDAVLRAMEVLRNRIDGLGVGETLIQRQCDNQILVQLPGVTDRNKAMDMVGRVAHLEFHIVNNDQTKLKEALAGQVPEVPGVVPGPIRLHLRRWAYRQLIPGKVRQRIWYYQTPSCLSTFSDISRAFLPVAPFAA